MSMSGDRDPLEPVATTVRVMSGMVAAVLVLTVAAAVFGSGSIFGIGSPAVCVEQDAAVVPGPDGDTGAVETASGVTASVRSLLLCSDEPTVGQYVLNVLTQVPSFLALIGALLLAAQLFRGMRRTGIFTAAAANRLRGVGWFVIVGYLVATLGESLARFGLLHGMTTGDVPALAWLGTWDFPVLALVFGVVLISVGRLLRISAVMRDDLAGTV
jgi:DUF2975 family protein